METLDDLAQGQLMLLEAASLKRTCTPSVRKSGRLQREGMSLVSFSCNDYLGLAAHPRVVGAGASRLVSGNHPLYETLEAQLAAMKNTAAACVFGSGYLANIGTLQALVGSGDLIMADRLSHACMLDGARLTGATLYRFAHNGVEHCKALLEDSRKEHQRCIILTETVFSMDGDRAPLAELRALADEYDAWLVTDDAHGLGVMPCQGKNEAHVQIGTLSKAVGAYGGYACANANVVELLRNKARSFVFSTALPPAVLAGSMEALKIMCEDAELCAKPLENARYFTALTGMPEAQSAIVPVIMGETERVLGASAMLKEKGYYVAAIRPPTVPANTARLRFAFSAYHTRTQVEEVAAALLDGGYICAA
jgi:8-amino-7-oxononanoate synthase